jgi:hypothetical protein
VCEAPSGTASHTVAAIDYTGDITLVQFISHSNATLVVSSYRPDIPGSVHRLLGGRGGVHGRHQALQDPVVVIDNLRKQIGFVELTNRIC